jgi:hypothetical protein
MAETIECLNSSMIHSFEYNEGDRILRVYFRGGQIYDYFFVPPEVAETFKTICQNPGDSAGRWFSQNVRRTFEFQKVA